MEIHKLEFTHRRTTWMMGRVDRLEKLKTRNSIFPRGAKRLSLLHIRAEHVCGVLLVQFPSLVQLFATPRTAARQASLSLTISWSLLRFVCIVSVVPFQQGTFEVAEVCSDATRAFTNWCVPYHGTCPSRVWMIF